MYKAKITCLECGSSRIVGIVKAYSGERIDWLDNNPDPNIAKIVSGRKRLDDEFGWQCICGNNDIMTKQETRYIKDKAAPQPKELATILKNLKPQKPQFAMERV